MTEIELQTIRGMADCMDMVRQELIEATIIEKTVPPMMVANAVMKYINECREDFNLAVDSVAELQEEVFELQRELTHWKANHANEVKRARVLIERPDIPLERVKAYELMGKLRDDNDQLRTELIAAYVSRSTLYDWCECIATVLEGRKTPLEGIQWDELVEVAAQVKEEAQRFAIVRHVARSMVDEGGEPALMEAMNEYKAEHGL